MIAKGISINDMGRFVSEKAARVCNRLNIWEERAQIASCQVQLQMFEKMQLILIHFDSPVTCMASLRYAKKGLLRARMETINESKIT